MDVLVITFLLLCILYVMGEQYEWEQHKPLVVEDSNLHFIADKINDNQRFIDILSHIILPRVVGSSGHKVVNQYIKSYLLSLDWHIETDAFSAKSPLNNGTIHEFENIIATKNPNASRMLILACHYDSKYFPDIEFFGASDSAVPCAMIIDLAQSLHDMFSKQQNNELSLQLVFFDGEEAFVEWNENDSLYGSRHLAQAWETADRLKKIDMLVLLDLIGLPDPQFYSLFRNTESWYSRLVEIEDRLAKAGHLHRDVNSGVAHRRSNAYFQDQSLNAFIDDDHVPFLSRGVPILHLIPVPFPEEWHTINDHWKAIDFVTVENLNRIIRVFVCEYLHINGTV